MSLQKFVCRPIASESNLLKNAKQNCGCRMFCRGVTARHNWMLVGSLILFGTTENADLSQQTTEIQANSDALSRFFFHSVFFLGTIKMKGLEFREHPRVCVTRSIVCLVFTFQLNSHNKQNQPKTN